MSPLGISLALGTLAGVANLSGAAIVAARAWSRTLLAYFIAIGAGFMLATALGEMVPESLRRSPTSAPALILAGYFIVHFFEHSWPAHFHYGEETHLEPFHNRHVAYLALGGLTIHTFFDGVAIASGFLISTWLGAVIFGATIVHNLPEGFTIASVMAAAQKSRAAGLGAAATLGISRLAGIMVMVLARRWVNEGLAISGGVTLYVAASDLIPEVNKMRGIRIALAVALGVVLVLLLRLAFPE
ncbi:MAG TPA: ZIP family metal transporter [Terriglobia bacterium]